MGSAIFTPTMTAMPKITAATVPAGERFFLPTGAGMPKGGGGGIGYPPGGAVGGCANCVTGGGGGVGAEPHSRCGVRTVSRTLQPWVAAAGDVGACGGAAALGSNA